MQVLSTFWRHFREYITYVLHRYGIAAERVIGVTPGRSEASMLGHSADDDAEYVNRAAEIGAWLDAHPEVTRFVVLDDRPSASDARLAPNFVHTKSTVGLTDADVRQALKILQG
uniref:Uncharacterized protein n=1 Tax=Chrysotila carterae TaxID=13221 RepID=A0A7S4C5F4_CHRCT